MASSVQSVISFGKCDIKTSTTSFTCSKKYIRELLKFSIINIMYNRINLPEHEFEEVNVRDIKMMKCKTSSKHPLIYKYYEWMKGAKDALERDFLKEFYLLFKNTDGELLEFFRFRVYYNFDDVAKENRIDHTFLYKQTKQVFDNIKILDAYKKWDENCLLTAEIRYNDNVSPSYQPPHFENCNPTDEADDEDELAIRKIEKHVQLFKVTTGFHTLKCLYGGDTTAPSSSASIAEEQEKQQQDNEKDKSVEPINVTIPSSPSSPSKSEDVVAADKICICESSVNHKALKIVHCTLCKKPFHWACFGSLGIPTATEKFHCVSCGGNAKIFHEGAMTAKDKILLIRLRLLVGFCNLTKEIPDEIMEGFENVSERNELWRKLIDLKVISMRNRKYTLNIFKVNENKFLKGLFWKRINDDSMGMVDLTEEDEETAAPAVKKMK